MSTEPKPATGEWTVKECEAFWMNEVKLLREQLATAVEALREIKACPDTLDSYDAANVAKAALAKIGGK